jgi:glycine cleavage system regulatory protein
VELQLVGDDRKGIVSSLTRILAMRSVSIENMHTEIVTSPGTGKRSFKVAAHLLVPVGLTNEQLHAELDGLAREMMLDVALGDRPGA